MAAASSSLSAAENRAAYLPWVEKYRPRTVNDVSHQTEVVESLRRSIEQKNLPHLIFYGPPGTGKTSTILACARELFGEHYKSRVMELNASDERGIAVVRNKVKAFAQIAVSSAGADVPPYKLIVLDEADSMTTDAQSALRRTMETYSKVRAGTVPTRPAPPSRPPPALLPPSSPPHESLSLSRRAQVTRFCIVCNYITRIIPPIASRCAKFRFKPLPQEAMIGRLNHICAQEGVGCGPDVLKELMVQSEGDMRRAIQMLQSVHRLYGDEMAPQAVLDVSGALPAATVKGIFETCLSNNFDALTSLATDLLAEGFPVSQIAQQMLEALLGPDVPVGNNQKSRVAVHLAETERQLIEGGSDMLQLMNVLAFVMRTFAQPKN
tara:strand:+ start:459 stop:1598 length:1140 start_codon:yes stop_codon:yes gene_type:complete